MRILLVIIAMMAGGAFAQSSVRVVSRTEGFPLAGARVLWLPEGHPPIGGYTDSLGQAVCPALAGKRCAVEVSAMGYARLHDTLSPEKNPTLELHPLTIDAVVITGQFRQSVASQAVQRVRVIDQERIQSMAAISVADVLSKELNIRLSQDAMLGSSMTMQGISGENVKILIDGVPVIGRQNGNIDLSQLNVGDIERIEVVQGPLSVSYGTNALAGTINLITVKGANKKPSASLMGYAESVGRYNSLLTASGSAGKWGLSGSLGRNLFDGWMAGDAAFPSLAQPVADSSRYKSWKPKWQTFGRGSVQRKVAKDLILSYKGGAFSETVLNRGLPRAPYNETAYDDEYHTRRIDNSLSLQGSAAGLRLNAFAAYNDYQRIKESFRTDLTTLERLHTTTPGDQDTSRMGLMNVRATLGRNAWRWLAWETGLDLNREWMYGQRIEGGSQQIGDYAIFATAELMPAFGTKRPLTVRPGLRMAYNTAYQAPVLPSLNARWQLAPSLTARAAYAQGFRAPSIKELYFNFVDSNHDIVGNPNLKAEESQHLSGGLSWKHAPKSGGLALGCEFTGFFNDIHNLITLAQTELGATTYSYANVGHVQTLGTNVEFSVSRSQWRATVGGGLSSREDMSAPSPLRDLLSSELSSSLNWDIAKTPLRLSAYWKYNGRLPNFSLDTDGNVVQTFTASYHTADLTLAAKCLHKHGLFTIGGKNLFNVQTVASTVQTGAHSSSTGSVSVGTGRTFFMSFTLFTAAQR